MILYVISTWGHGRGGHFNTLATYLKPLTEDFRLLVIGENIPPVLEEFRTKIIQDDIEIFPNVKPHYKYEVIHCFDEWAYLYGYLIALKLSKVKLVLTKSGGINTIWYPRSRNMWMISKENYIYYRRFKAVKNISFYDNRIIDFPIKERSEFFERNSDKRIVLRIGRVSEYYKKSFEKMINYSSKCKELKFIVIGTIESQTLLEQLESSGIEVLHSAKYTSMAKSYLGFADIFIGQGRSAMEAIFKGIPTFVFNKKTNDLNLVDEENILEVKHQNFSERASFDSSYNLEQYAKNCEAIKKDNLKRFVEYDPSQILEFYDSLESKKVNLRSFPVILYLRFLRKITKLRK